MRKNYIREKKIYCSNDYMEVDIYALNGESRDKGAKRSKKVKVSEPKQKNLNDKNAKRYFTQKVHANFKADDLYITLTYTNSTLPKTIEEAEKNIQNYVRRLKRARKKQGLDDLKYISVVEHKSEQEGDEENIRVHHHMIINSGLDRDVVEELWRHRKKKGEKEKKIGLVNAVRLQEDYASGLTSISKYLVKDSRGKKRWTCSKNLKQPVCRTNDFKYTFRKIEQIAKQPIDVAYWEKQYKGWTIKDKIGGYEARYNEYTGWSIYIKLRRKE